MSAFQHVFLIDDDSISNFITERLIVRENLAEQLATFNTAEDALKHLGCAIETEDITFPALILLDLNMPGMNGWDFLEEYQKLPENFTSKCALYMLSSAVDAKDIVHARSLHLVEDFLSKPLTEEDIAILRERHLTGYITGSI